MLTCEKQNNVTNYQARNKRGAWGLVSPEKMFPFPRKMCWI